jgi:hypothetical protein
MTDASSSWEEVFAQAAISSSANEYLPKKKASF